MLSKISCAIALIAGAYAIETESEQRYGGSNQYQQKRPSYGNESRSLRSSEGQYSAPRRSNGYGKRAAPKSSYSPSPYAAAPTSAQTGQWEKRDTGRPAFVSAFNAAPVDQYYLNEPKPTHTIRAVCEFDFLGYSESKGTIELTQDKDDLVAYFGEFTGMQPGLHALRIHEFGDLENGCKSTGEIYNPFGSPHGHSHNDINTRRVGDIEHIQARFDTNAEYRCRDSLTTMWGVNSILGRSLVIYEREDDFDQTEHEATADREERKSEGKGEAVACCVIGLAKQEKDGVDAIINVGKTAATKKAQPL